MFFNPLQNYSGSFANGPINLIGLLLMACRCCFSCCVGVGLHLPQPAPAALIFRAVGLDIARRAAPGGGGGGGRLRNGSNVPTRCPKVSPGIILLGGGFEGRINLARGG